MATTAPSAKFRARLRAKIRERIEQLGMSNADAGEQMGFSRSQMSKLSGDQDLFTLDRLVDAAVRFDIVVHLSATRHYRNS